MRLIESFENCLVAKTVAGIHVLLECPQRLLDFMDSPYIDDNGPTPQIEHRIYRATVDVYGSEDDGQVRVRDAVPVSADISKVIKRATVIKRGAALRNHVMKTWAPPFRGSGGFATVAQTSVMQTLAFLVAFLNLCKFYRMKILKD